jgi:hypothetical protein
MLDRSSLPFHQSAYNISRYGSLFHSGRCEDRVTPSTALRLAKAFGTSPEFWLNGQLAPDLYRVINDNKDIKEVEKIERVLH